MEAAESIPPTIATAAFVTPLVVESGPAVTVEFAVTLGKLGIGTAAARPLKSFVPGLALVIKGGATVVAPATVSAAVDFSVEGVLVMMPTAELAVADPVVVLVTSVANDKAELTTFVTEFAVVAA